MSPARRAVLRSVPLLTVGVLAGCLASDRGSRAEPLTNRPTQVPGTDRETPVVHETQAPTPIPHPGPQVTTAPLTLTLFNEADVDHTVTVSVTQGDDTVYESDYRVGPGGIAESPLVELDPGAYDLTVVDAQGVNYRFDWEVPTDGTADGQLSVVVRTDGTLEPTLATRHYSGPEESTCNDDPC